MPRPDWVEEPSRDGARRSRLAFVGLGLPSALLVVVGVAIAASFALGALAMSWDWGLAGVLDLPALAAAAALFGMTAVTVGSMLDLALDKGLSPDDRGGTP